jgi:hypothetical protein
MKKYLFGGSDNIIGLIQLALSGLDECTRGVRSLPDRALSDEDLCTNFIHGNFAGMLRPLGYDTTRPNDDLLASTGSFGPSYIFHEFDYRLHYSEDTILSGQGGDGIRDPCRVRALFADCGTELSIICIVDDMTGTTYTPTHHHWTAAKNQLYKKVVWISQISLHLGNHLRLGPVAIEMYKLPAQSHWLFQLLHPFMLDLPFVNEFWGADLILEGFTGGFGTDTKTQSLSLLKKASLSTIESSELFQRFTPCGDRRDTFKDYSAIVHDCLRVFVQQVVATWYHVGTDQTVELFIQHVRQLRYPNVTADNPSLIDRQVVIDTLVWILYEASFVHSMYHIAPKSTYAEHHELRSGTTYESSFRNYVGKVLATPEAVTSLYPLKLDTVGTFKLDPTSISVLRDALHTKLDPFLKDVMKAPATIITTHGH